MYKSATAISSAYEEMKQAKDKLIEILANENGYWEHTVFVVGAGDEQGQNIQQKIITKGGAEIIAQLLDLDIQLSEPSYKNIYREEDPAGQHVVVTAKAYKDGKELAQGAGARSVSYDTYTLNTSIKMAQKSAFIDVVIRAARLSSIFMQEPPAKDEATPTNTPQQPMATTAKEKPADAENAAVKKELITQIKEKSKELSGDFAPMFGKNSLQELSVKDLEEIILMISSSQKQNQAIQKENAPVVDQENGKEEGGFSDDFLALEDEENDIFVMP